MESSITIKGQTTIPKAVRDHLGLKTGGRVKFFIHPDGQVVMLAKRPASELRAAARGYVGPPVSLDDMDQAVADEAARRAADRT